MLSWLKFSKCPLENVLSVHLGELKFRVGSLLVSLGVPLRDRGEIRLLLEQEGQPLNRCPRVYLPPRKFYLERTSQKGGILLFVIKHLL